MADIKIQSKSEKLKFFRKKYKLNQQELAGDDINRTLISYIESGKVDLTEKTAHIIANNANKVAKEKNLDFHVTAEFFLEDETDQVKRLLIKKIDELEVFLNNKQIPEQSFLDELSSFLFDKGTSVEKGIIYERLGELQSSEDKSTEQHIYYSKSFEQYLISEEYNRLISLTHKLCSNRIRTKNFHEAIRFSAIMQSTITDLDRKTMMIMHYNNGIAYSGMNLYEKAVEEYEAAYEIMEQHNNDRAAQILLNLGICYSKLDDKDNAKDLFLKASNIFEDLMMLDLYCVCLQNISTIVRDEDTLDEEFKHFKITRLNQNVINSLPLIKNNNPYLCRIYYNIGQSYKHLSNIIETEQYYIKAINAGFSNNYISKALDILNSTFDFLAERKLIQDVMTEDIVDLILNLDSCYDTKEKVIAAYLEHLMNASLYDSVKTILKKMKV